MQFMNKARTFSMTREAIGIGGVNPETNAGG